MNDEDWINLIKYFFTSVVRMTKEELGDDATAAKIVAKLTEQRRDQGPGVANGNIAQIKTALLDYAQTQTNEIQDMLKTGVI